MENRPDSHMKFFFCAAVWILGALPLQAAKVARMQIVMGTTLEIEVESKKEATAQQAIESAFSEVKKWDDWLSNYKEDSQISKINRDGFRNEIFVDTELLEFLSRSKQFGEMTSGAFDITVEPLTRLWKLRERKLSEIPDQTAIDRAREKVNYKNLKISTSAQTVQYAVEGMGIDTGGVGKGFALDKALAKIRQYPAQSAALNFGGEILYWSQKPELKSVGIKNPLEPETFWKTVKLKIESSGISTSANYERYVTVTSTSGKKLSHILDPKTGRPVESKVRSVTVISPNATDADAFSTAIFVMGLEEGKTFSNGLREDGVLILYEPEDKSLQSFESENWKKLTQ